MGFVRLVIAILDVILSLVWTGGVGGSVDVAIEDFSSTRARAMAVVGEAEDEELQRKAEEEELQREAEEEERQLEEDYDHAYYYRHIHRDVLKGRGSDVDSCGSL